MNLSKIDAIVLRDWAQQPRSVMSDLAPLFDTLAYLGDRGRRKLLAQHPELETRIAAWRIAP